MRRTHMTSIEELVMRTAHTRLYGPAFAWEAAASRNRAPHAPRRTVRGRAGLRIAVHRMRPGGRTRAAEAGARG